MSGRQRAPRRAKRSVRIHLGRFWILIVAVVALLIAGAAFAEFWPGFYPSRIVVSGNARVDRATVLRAAAIDRHRSIWLQNIRRMAQRVAAIPFVGKATIRRYPPGIMTVRITERVPFAIAWRGEQYALVDDTLRVLEMYPDGNALPAFIVPGSARLTPGTFLQSADALAMRDAYTTLKNASFAPVRLEFDRYDQLEVTMADGLRLLLGDPGDLESKVRLCSAILAQTGEQHRRPAIVDVRAPSTPVVTYATHR